MFGYPNIQSIDLPYRLKPTDKLYFLHIAKTGGRTFEAFLKERMGATEANCITFIVPDGYPVHVPSQELEHPTLFLGHMGYRFLSFFPYDRKPFWITMLRDPVERVVSHYYFLRNLQPMTERHFAYFVQQLACSLPLEKFVKKKEVLRLVENHQLYCLLDHPYHPPAVHDRLWGSYPPEKLVDLVKYRLANECLFFGITEYFPRSLALLCHTFGWDMPDNPHARLTVTPEKPEEISPEALELIREKTVLEYELYQFALNLFNQRCDKLIGQSGGW
jgi:hypothetical protein